MKMTDLKIHLQRAINDKLQTRVETLLEEREKLQDRVKDLKVSAKEPDCSTSSSR